MKKYASLKLLIVISIFLLMLSTTGQKNSPTTARLTWAQPQLQISTAAGGQSSSAISFTSNRDVQNVSFQITGTAAQFIAVNPATLSNVPANVAQSLNVQLIIPNGTPAGNYSGTIIATAGTRNLNDILPVNLQISVDTVTGTIHPSGGTLTLPDVATVTFSSGAFPAGTNVRLSKTTSPATQSEFEETAALFSAGPNVPYQIKIDTGNVSSETSFEVAAKVPESFLQTLPPNAEIRVFAQIWEESSLDILDHFELLGGNYDPNTKTISVTLPGYVLTSERNGISNEAIIVVGTTPTRQTSNAYRLIPESEGLLASFQSNRIELIEPVNLTPFNKTDSEELRSDPRNATATCQGSTLGPPLEGKLNVRDHFDPTSNNARGRPHYGTDYRAANGDTVISAADGTVDLIRTQRDPNTGSIKGWGRYVVIKHTDGSKTLYAHLIENSTDIIQVGQAVIRGQRLGLSDSTGRVTGPHLHFEYSLNGNLHGLDGKVDPHPCIGATDGSIVVRDNGPIADDSFSVTFRGILLGNTEIGGSGTFAVNNLLPGTYPLRITAVVAPDNAGTYEARLANGLTFEGGGTTRSGTLSLNQSESYMVIVPSNSPLANGSEYNK